MIKQSQTLLVTLFTPLHSKEQLNDTAHGLSYHTSLSLSAVFSLTALITFAPNTPYPTHPSLDNRLS